MKSTCMGSDMPLDRGSLLLESRSHWNFTTKLYNKKSVVIDIFSTDLLQFDFKTGTSCADAIFYAHSPIFYRQRKFSFYSIP